MNRYNNEALLFNSEPLRIEGIRFLDASRERRRQQEQCKNKSQMTTVERWKYIVVLLKYGSEEI